MLQSNSTNQASSFDVRIDIKHLPLKYSDLLLKELNKTYLNKTLIFQKLKFKSALNVECQCAAPFCQRLPTLIRNCGGRCRISFGPHIDQSRFYCPAGESWTDANVNRAYVAQSSHTYLFHFDTRVFVFWNGFYPACLSCRWLIEIRFTRVTCPARDREQRDLQSDGT